VSTSLICTEGSSFDPPKEVHDRLKPIAAANYNSNVAPTGCLEGTRVAIHNKLSDWANEDASGLTMLWVNGMAGTGKTAIASTFAKNMDEQGILWASFFIDRQHAERRDPHRIVQTLAYDLAKHNHAQIQALWAFLRDNPTFESMPCKDQVRHLIEEPLDVGCPKTLVIVIDGLDECVAPDGVSLLVTLVTTLAHHPVKLFVTSRNESQIISKLCDLPHTPLNLQEMAVSGDVRLYWEHNLDELCRTRRLLDWKPIISLELLVELTGHLFVYATTILKIIRNTRSSPIKKLRDLLEISQSGTGSAIAFVGSDNHGPLEKLYIHIVGEAVKDDDGNMSTEYAHQIHDILEVVIFAREPVTPQALSDLLNMDMDELWVHLSFLNSVLVVPNATSRDEVVRPLHQSFLDFVCQQGGLVHPKLTMHVTVAEKHLTELCLLQLSKHLHRDMCRIKDASLFNSEVLDLKTRLNEFVSAALRYSCRFWITHLLHHIRAAGAEAKIPLGLTVFCGRHLLHWIEVLSLIGDIDAVQRVLPELILVMNVRVSLPCYSSEVLNSSLGPFWLEERRNSPATS
jgi:hypothetical protein